MQLISVLKKMYQGSFMNKLFIALILIIFCITGCSAKKPLPPKPDRAEQTIIAPADLKDFPQNLEVYAKNTGVNKLLLPYSSQEESYHSFLRVFFGPWQMTRTSVKRSDISGALNRRASGYKDGTRVWTQSEWDSMRNNANLAQFPSRALPAITLRNTNLREVPTSEPRFTEPTPNVRDNPFDYFQYSLLPPGTPVLIAHTSLDGRWHYIECPVAGGWVKSADIAIVDESFQHTWREKDFAALIKDKVILPGTGIKGGDSKAGIGAILPLQAVSATGILYVLVPVKDKNGYANSAEIELKPGEAVKMPWPLTPGNMARLGNEVMGQPYGWGGMLGERDCSALMRELFTPFGIWLPRNSASQAKRGRVISLQGMTASEKTSTILKNAVPFLSLIGMRGHITLYVGEWKGKAAIFHNVWGLRIHKNGNDNERLVIGKAVVTSISPGMEIENLYRPVTFVDRLRTITTPGSR